MIYIGLIIGYFCGLVSGIIVTTVNIAGKQEEKAIDKLNNNKN